MNNIYHSETSETSFDALRDWIRAMYRSAYGRITLMNVVHDIESSRLPNSLLCNFFQTLNRRWLDREAESEDSFFTAEEAIKLFNELLKPNERETDLYCCQCNDGPTFPYHCSRVMLWKKLLEHCLDIKKIGLPRLNNIPENHIQVILKSWHGAIYPGAMIRGKRPFAWVTETEKLKDRQDAGNSTERASRVRDALGLLPCWGYVSGQRLVEVQYPPEDLNAKAPTFLESECGENVYRSRRTPDGWGRTVNLRNFGDDLPEAVHSERHFNANYELHDLGSPSYPDPTPNCSEFLSRSNPPNLDRVMSVLENQWLNCM